MASDTPAPRRGGFSLDLSTGRAPAAPRAIRRAGPPPVVVQTINLSTPKPEKAAHKAKAATPEAARPGAATPEPAAPAPRVQRRDERRDERGSERPAPRGGGTSLADLLDADTLARLRGAGR